MSIQARAWALEQDLPARPKLVLVAIANHANHTDGYCWLNAETIAREASCSPRAVFNFVGDLIRNGYVRKAHRRGDNGRQRANDYWILFAREPVKWASRGEQDAEIEADSASAETDDEPQDVVEPHAPACMHIDSAEPSKTKPKENLTDSESGERRFGLPPRAYRPPPPQPVADVTQGEPPDPMKFFVFDGTPGFDAWCAYKTKTLGRPWYRSMGKHIEGKGYRTGWYFPSMFPPGHGDTGPPDDGDQPLSDSDLKALTG